MSKFNLEMPEPSFGEMIPTLNQRGFMSATLDEYSNKFVEYAATTNHEVLDIGCAYGVATLAALEKGVRVLAVDIDPGHLIILKQRIPEAHRTQVRTLVAALPEVDFPDQSFGAILAARVMHFLLGPDIELAVRKMRRWLKTGGKLFLTADTPYTGFWSSIASEYERKKQEGDPWPGLISDVRPLLNNQLPSGMLPYLNPLDADILARVCREAGFTVEEAGMFGRSGNPEKQKHCGVVAY